MNEFRIAVPRDENLDTDGMNLDDFEDEDEYEDEEEEEAEDDEDEELLA